MSIVEYRQLKPDHNPLPNSPLYNDLFKRTKRDDADYENEDDDGDSEESEANEDVAQQMVYEQRRKKVIGKKGKSKKRSRSANTRSSSEPPKKKVKGKKERKEKKKNKKMAENGPKNIANEFILTEAEEEITEEEKSWSDQGEEIRKKELKKKQQDDADNLVDCLGCIMDAEEIDGVNKTYPKTVCKRCKDWGTTYGDVLEWMETCIGCVMCERSDWEKCPPNMVCDICKKDDVTYEEAKKWETGGDDKLYCFDYEEGNVDLVLTEKGEKLIDSFDDITFESDPRSGYGYLTFDCKSDAIDFLKMYRGYETGYKRYKESFEIRINQLEDQVKNIQSLNETNE